MKVQEKIDRLNEILKNASIKTPYFLNGVLIPRWHLEEFYLAIHYLMDKAKDSEKYKEQIIEATHNGEKATHDFMKALMDGKIKIVKKD